MALTHDKDAPDPRANFDDGPAPETYGGVADVLRNAREEHGQDLRTVAQVLRIRFTYLEAIETGEFDRLPGTAYALGFLRTYAEFLGLDGEEIVERFKEESQEAERKPELVFPEPMTDGRIPGGAIILISVLLLAAAYGGWFYFSNQGKSVADLIPPLPERLQTMAAGEEGGVFESASVDKPAGSEQAQPFTAPETESGAPTGPAETAGEPGVAVAPGESEAAAAVVEAPTGTETAKIQSGAGTTSEPEPATPSPEPETSAEATVVQDAATTPTVAAVPEAPATASQAPLEPVAAQPVEPRKEPTRPAAAQIEDTSPGSSGSGAAPAAPDASRSDAVDQPAPAQPTAAFAASTSSELPNGGPSPSGMTPPLLEETVVIPSPPSVPQAMSLSSDRSPRVYGESTDGTRIVLRALQDSWVQVRDRQDALLLTRVLRVGDTYFVPAQDGLTLLTGNAGGIEIEVDGVRVPPLGPIGAVRRQIALDPTRLLSGTATAR